MITRVSPDRSIRVNLDASEIFPDDPGQGTPVIVELRTGETATWNCATAEGECDGKPLNQRQLVWLEAITPYVEKWMEDNGA